MSRLAGTWQLTRLALRRDRILLPVWIGLFAFMTAVSAAGTMALYPSAADRAAAAVSINEVPTFVAMYGRVWDPTSLGELSMIKMSGLGAVFIAILAIILVVRHTRAEEEADRTELLDSAPVGVWAQLASAVVVAAGAMATIGLLSACSLIAIGLPAAGSATFALAWVAAGLAFASIAALAAQVTLTARGATVLSMLALSAAYVLRAVGDVLGSADGSAWPAWLSPIGWSQQARAFAGNEPAVLLLSIVFAGLLLAVAAVIAGRRDLGSGLIPGRSGRAQATWQLRGAWGLAWREQRGLLAAWACGYALMAWLLGSIASDLTGLLSSPQAQRMIEALGGSQSVVDGFIGLEFSFFAFITAAYGIAVVRRVGTEEASGRSELVLSGAVSRTALLMSHAVIAIVGAALLSAIQWLAFSLSDARQSGGTGQLPSYLAAAAVWLPAIWAMTGLAVLLVGIAPRLVPIAWAALGVFTVVAELGSLLSWPAWAQDLSPFAHTPLLPGEQMSWPPVILVAAVAACLFALGIWRFSRRDVQSA